MPENLENSEWPQDWKMSVFTPISKKTIPKNVQTTIQLYSFHMLVSLCSKSFKLDFINTWAENLQIYKLGWRRQKNQIKLPTFIGSWKKQGNSKKTSISASLTMLKPLTVWITTNCGKFLKRWEYPDHPTCLLRNLYAVQKATVKTGHGTMNWFQIGKGVW